MTHTVAILTGASRGLGAALAFGLAQQGTHLITVSRNLHPDLARHALSHGCTLDEHSVDLSHPASAQAAATRVFAGMPRNAQRYVLINNAGTLGPVGAVGLQQAEAIAAALNLNVTAAMVFTGHFLHATRGLTANRRILHISSGAGRSPVGGWSVYCSSKAALDMHARAVNAEQGSHGARIVSLAPGVIDTDMQAEIRATPAEDFPSLPRFQTLHAEGQLASPPAVASRILTYLERDDFGATDVDDIRHY